MRIVVYGQPAPQGSKRYVGNGVMVEMSKRLQPWREAVKAAALTAMALDYPDHQRWDCPLVVAMVFTFDRPRSHYRTGKWAHLLRDGVPTAPTGPPDLSKLARATEDALTDAGVWRDDSRVVDYRRLSKVYANRDDGLADPGALLAPGAVITIRTLSTVEATRV